MDDSIRSGSSAAVDVRPAVADDALRAMLRGTPGSAPCGRFDRRLAAVLLADVADYSRLMERDEDATHFRISVLRSALIEPTIERHGGTIVRSKGDDVLVQFASATNALRCAVEIQRALARCNDGVAADEQIRLRMGLNVADILFDGDDIAGSGVNLAARLESLAAPGEICISQALRDHVHQSLDVRCVDAGWQRVKNFSKPVHVYRIVPSEAVASSKAFGARIGARIGERFGARFSQTLRSAWSWAAVASSAALIAAVAALAMTMPVLAG